jgi:hypothetical protein
MPRAPRARDDRGEPRPPTDQRRTSQEYDDEYEEDYEYDEDDQAMPAALAARTALKHVAELSGKQASGVTSLERADGGWVVGVEVVEDRRIPSSADILAVYLAEIDADGSLQAYHRIRRYPRGRGDGSEADPR